MKKLIKEIKKFDKLYGYDKTNEPKIVNLVFSMIGLVGEAGEASNIVKKIWRDGITEEKIDSLEEELIDILIYLIKLLIILDTDFDKAWLKKSQKLIKRWGNKPRNRKENLNDTINRRS